MNSVQKILKLLPSEYDIPAGLTDERLLRFICQNDFLSFCMAVRPDFLPTKFHVYLAGKFQQIYEDTNNKIDRRYIIACPPQLGKSTITTQLFPAWVLGKESWPVICASYSADLAERNSLFCRSVVDSDIYKVIFPKVRLNPDSTSKAYWQTNKGGSYRAVGTLGGLTGYSGRLLLADDLLSSQAEADSATISDGVWSWFKTVFYTRKQSKSAMVLIATRWSLNDPTGRLLDQQIQYESMGLPEGSYDKWDYLSFPAIAEADEDFGDGWTRKAGAVICPERFTLEDMIKTRNSLVSEGKVQEWSSLYQQEPILQENATFRSEWFKFFSDEDIKDKDLIKFTLVDLAISKKKTADNTVVMTVGKDRNGPNWYVLEYAGGHFDPQETIDHIFDHSTRYGSSVFIESVGFQASLESFVLEEQRKRQKYFTVNQIKNASARKVDRIAGLVPFFKTGVLFIRKNMIELQKELLQFPKSAHDDFCLTSHTQIATIDGYKSIVNIKAGEKVWTRQGLRKVLWSGKTGTKKVMTKLGITGTPNHPVWTENRGWIDLRLLKDLDIIICLESQLSGMEKPIIDIQHQKEGSFEYIFMLITKIKVRLMLYTEMFGSFLMEKLKRVRMSIIKRGQMIISFLLSRLLLQPNMEKSIGNLSKILKEENAGFENRPHNHRVLLLKDEQKESLKHKEKKSFYVRNIFQKPILYSPVKTVALLFAMLLGEKKEPVFPVGISDGIKLDILKESGFQKEIVSFVENFTKIPVKTYVSVLKNVGIKTQCVDREREEDVYNLEVEGEHEYFANGILVHNCDTLSFLLSVKSLTVFEKSEVKKADTSYTAMWRARKGNKEFDPHKSFNSVS